LNRWWKEKPPVIGAENWLVSDTGKGGKKIKRPRTNGVMDFDTVYDAGITARHCRKKGEKINSVKN